MRYLLPIRPASLRQAALLAALALAVVLLAAPGTAWAKRMALVVGNSAYSNVPALANARSDAEDIAAALRRLNFDVTLLADIARDDFLAALDSFAERSAGAETTLFYFSGHGFQLNGVNYLAPVEARLNSREAIETETWRLDAVIGRLQSRDRQTLILLDACRNNPLPRSMQGAGLDGLAQPETGANTFIAFATQPNNVTFDGVEGRNSPFTAALLEHLDTPGISVSDMMIRVRNAVEDRTLRRQTPWDQSSLRAQFYFSPVTETGSGLTASDLELLAGLPPERRRQFLRLLAASGVVLDVAAAEQQVETVAVEIAALPPQAQPARAQLPFAAAAPGLQLLPDSPAQPPGPAVQAEPEQPPTVVPPPDPGLAVRAAEAREAETAREADRARIAAQQDRTAERATAAADASGTVLAARPSAAREVEQERISAQQDRTAERATAAADASGTVLAALPDAARATEDPAATRAVSSLGSLTPSERPADEEGVTVLAALPPERARTGATALPRIVGREVVPETPEAAEAPAAVLEAPPANIVAAVQTELQRLGCYRARIDGQWGPQSARALARFLATTDFLPDSLDPTVEIWRLLRQEDKVACEHTEAVARAAPPETRQPEPQPVQPSRPTLTQQRPGTQQQAPAVQSRPLRGVFR